jgi:hypothetical protein
MPLVIHSTAAFQLINTWNSSTPPNVASAAEVVRLSLQDLPP